MRRHTLIGADIVADIDFLGNARDVIRSHHERWDGAGYPDGLAGEQIPLAARVVALADALDALTTDRPYRPGRSLAAAREEIDRVRGAQFDPDVVDVFQAVPDAALEEIRERVG
jgi:ribonuclease P protein subunit RPR2